MVISMVERVKPEPCEHIDEPETQGKDPAAVSMGKRGAAARNKSTTPDQRKAIAQKAAAARWEGEGKNRVVYRWGTSMSLNEIEREAIEAFEKEAGVNVVRPHVPRKVKKKNRAKGAASSGVGSLKMQAAVRRAQRDEERAKRAALADDAVGYCIELGWSMQEVMDATGTSAHELKRALERAREGGADMRAYEAGIERARAATVIKHARKRMGHDD
jgi:hypothetical protein